MASITLLEQAEKWLIGALLANPDLAKNAKHLDPRCFNRHDLRLIFQSIVGVLNAGDIPDMPTVAMRLSDNGSFDDVGGSDALIVLADNAPYVSHIGEWVNRIAADYERRTLVSNSQEAIHLANDPTVGNDELRNRMLSVLSATTPMELSDEYRRLDHQDRPDPLPAWVYEAPGIIGEMVKYNAETAPRVQPELALFGAFALVATVCGQKIRTESDIRPNIYVLGIAEASHGKDSPRKAASKALAEAGLTKYLAPEKPRSDKALIHILAKQGSVLMQVDEIAHWLAAISSENASQWSRGLSSCLKELFSQSDRPHVAPFSAGDGKDDQILSYPHLNVYGTCQPLLWQNVTMDSVTDGLLARMLICQSTVEFPELRTPIMRPVGDPVIAILKAWDEHVAGAGNLAGAIPDAQPIYFDSAAEIRLSSHSAKIEEKLRSDETPIRIIWMRASVMARKLAMLFAASRGPISLAVTIDDANRAIACVNWSVRTLVYNVRANVGESQASSDSKAMLSVIRRHQRCTVRKVFNNHSVRKIEPRMRHVHLHALVDGGQAEVSGDMNYIGKPTNIVTYVHE